MLAFANSHQCPCGQDDGTDTFEETYARVWPAAWPESEAEEAAADSTKGVGGSRIVVKPTNGPTGHGNNDGIANPRYVIAVAAPRL